MIKFIKGLTESKALETISHVVKEDASGGNYKLTELVVSETDQMSVVKDVEGGRVFTVKIGAREFRASLARSVPNDLKAYSLWIAINPKAIPAFKIGTREFNEIPANTKRLRLSYPE